jgi:soluble lytic murein transglycosylase-like protein
MTIKNLSTQLAALSAPKPPVRQQNPAIGGFAATLATAAQTQSATATTDQTRVAVELARLQMMRGALSLDGEDGEQSPWSTALSSLAGLATPPTTPPMSQRADNVLGPLKVPLAAAPTPAPTQAAIPGPLRVPQAVESIVDRASRRYGVDPALIKAVIKAESSFDQHAVSPVGAQGLMQLMPGTASDLGVKNPLDAEQNVMGGTKYLKGLLKKYDGQIDKALAAYNWGPGNVDRRGIDILPRETRDYLAKVKRYYEHYSA